MTSNRASTGRFPSREKPASTTDDNNFTDEKNKEAKRPKQGNNSYIRIFSYADRLSWTLNIVAIVAAICSGTLLPLMNLVFGQFVTAFTNFATKKTSPADYRSEVNRFTLYFVYLFIGKFVLFYIHSVCISISAIRTTKAIRVDYVKHTLKQDVAFFDRTEAGSITSYLSTNANNINTGISEKLTLTVQGVSTFVTAFVIAFSAQWKLTLITIAVVPTIIIIVGLSVVHETKNESQVLSIQARAGQLAEEVFATMRTVHSYWLQPLLSKQYGDILDEAMHVGMKKSKNYAVLFSTEFFCVYCAYALAFWQGIRMYIHGEIKSSGSVFVVILAVVVAATTMSTIAPQIVVFTKAASAAEELFKTIDRESQIDPTSEKGQIPAHCHGQIELRNVHFAYPTRPDVAVLQDFSLVAPANSTTAIVGPSGSGKSTCVGLLERWYDASAGSITLDGVAIRDLNLKWLRTNVRLVQQEPVLLSGTVFENVACGLYGTPLADLPEAEQRTLVKEACESAYASEFVDRLPHVGERAIMLSGGQKQRIAIARSIISNPRVLLLDEATSALDPKAEKMVQLALDKVSKNRTTIVIAHKLSTVRNADNIMVMTDGAVVEQGTHDALIKADGAYARLVRAQDLGHADNDTETDEKTDYKTEGMALTRTETQAISVREPATNLKGDGINYNLIKCIFILFKEHLGLWRYFLILLIGSILGGFTFPAQALLFARIARAFEIPPGEAIRTGDFYSLMFFIVALGNLLAYGLIGFFSNRVVQNVARSYRQEIFDLLLKQDMSFFDKQENASGSLAANLSNYPNSLNELMGFNIMLMVICIVNVVSSSILAIVVGWKLGLAIVFGALPLVVFLGYLRIRLEFKLEERIAKEFGSSAGLASEAVAAIRTVSSLALESYIVGKYKQQLDGAATKSIKAVVSTMFWYSITQSISFLAMALGFWYGGQLISRGEYNTVQFYTVFIAVIFSGEAAAQFFSYTSSMTKAGTAANYIFRLRRQQVVVREDPSKPPFEADRGGPAHIQVQDVSFAYESRPNTHVLQSVDVDAMPGQFIAFVGASGCGKSSLISLLERFYDPSAGRILYDDQSLTDLCPRKYRSGVSLVQQEPVLYQGSIRDNIAMGAPEDIGIEAVEAAAKQANIHTFVASLPDGMNTSCGSRGTQLSGGQRQRIAIARALIRQPRLLLLDEATSALDTESEKIVQTALEIAKAGRTTIAVAHRLSTIKDADVIVVFARGNIVEMGSHNDLLARGGMYYDMCQGQRLDRSVA